jgi:nitrogen fixation protein FixH
VKARSPAADATLVEVAATDAGSRPLTGLQASARLAHPTDKRADHIVELHETAPGRFQGTAGAVVGQWALKIELSREGARMFRSRNRVFLR